MGWERRPFKWAPGLDTAGRPEDAKRFTATRLDELIWRGRPWIEKVMRDLGIDAPEKAVEWVVKYVDYPRWMGKPDDKHVYNCYSSDTEVLTERGWKFFPELRKDDKIATLNRKGELEYQNFTHFWEYNHKGKMIKIQSSSINLLVTPDHNMYVRRRHRGDWYDNLHFEKAINLKRGWVKVPKTARWNCTPKKEWIIPGYEIHYRCGTNYGQINTSKRSDKHVPIETWLKFLGYYISEGCVSRKRYVIISQLPSSPYYKEIVKTVKEMGYSPILKGHRITICDAQLARYLLTQFGSGCEDKRLTKEVKSLPPSQLEILFNSLMDGDGYRGKTWVYSTKSKRLADDVQEILLKMGYASHISCYNGKHGKYYEVRRITKGNGYALVQAARHVSEVDYEGKVYDVTVPNHVLLVRRGGIPVFSGNCFHGRRCFTVKEDLWQSAEETLLTYALSKEKRALGDCLEENTEILMADYTRKKIKDIQVGDLVLSYDFSAKRFRPARVTKKWDKGFKETYRIYLRNGTWFDATLDHRIFTWKKSIFWNVKDYEKDLVEKRLGDPSLQAQHKSNYILVVRKLPEIGSLSIGENKAFLVGNYLAEGWKDNGHVATSGITDEVLKRLEEEEIPYTFRERGTSSYIRYLKSPFKEFLKQFGSNAFNKKMTSLLKLPSNELTALLKGYADGDAYYEKRKKVVVEGRVVNTNKKLTYATSSDELAKDLITAHYILGRPLNVWLQTDHKGVGNHPIWRLTENTNSHFNKPTLPYLSKVSIKKFERLGLRHVYDIEVEPTHNFILAFSGVVVHNCEDSSILLTAMLRILGVPCWCCLGVVKNLKTGEWGGHAWVIAILGGVWRLVETTLDELPKGGWPAVDPGAYVWTFGNLEYRAYVRFNDEAYEEWIFGATSGQKGTPMNTFEDYLRLGRRERENARKYELISLEWGVPAKALRARNKFERLASKVWRVVGW